MDNILEENYRIPYSVYQSFYKELGVENVLGAIKLVGIKKDFQTAFKKSEAYEKYLIDFKNGNTEYYRPEVMDEKIFELYNIHDGKIIYDKLCNGGSYFTVGVEYGVDKGVIYRYFRSYLKPIFGDVVKVKKISDKLFNNIEEVKQMIKKGFSNTEIAKKFEVNPPQVTLFISYHKLNQ